jgi:hypothetical protein
VSKIEKSVVKMIVTDIRGLMAGTQILHGDRPNAHRAHDIRGMPEAFLVA